MVRTGSEAFATDAERTEAASRVASLECRREGVRPQTAPAHIEAQAHNHDVNMGVRRGGRMMWPLLAALVTAVTACLAWPATARADTVNPWQYFYDHSVYLVGDSLTCGMRPYVPYAFPGRDVVTDCFPGIVIAQADTMIRDREALPPLAPTAVVAVGSNDREPLEQFLWYVEGTIDLFPPTERILWVNFYRLLPGSNDAAKNAIVAWDATTFHHNVTVVDWASVIAPHPEDFVPDGMHYTPDGYWLRAQTIAAAVGP